MTPVPPVVQRLRVAAVCSILTGLVFLQEPGLVVTDTKLDLTVDPVGWLSRALHLWEPHGWLGQVQNQAYGYLFPMGPFFAAGHLLGVPEWVVQRTWTALLMCVAVIGVTRLAARLGLGSPGTQLAAGVLFALSPRFLTTLGPISAETLPMAMAPWILLPLVPGDPRWRPRTAAARSGLAVLACGAVNATATLAVLLLPLLYLATRRPGQPRRRTLSAWLAAVVAACTWWVVPLLLLGSVSPPFLDWIESARITTIPTSLLETLRGTSHWVAYTATSDGPFWQGGWLLVTSPLAVLDTVVIAALGVIGLSRRDLPERRWLALSALVGVVAVTFGHVGPLDAPWAEWSQGLLDGALAPFRNVHKFDPVLRLPLALASAWALAHLSRVIRTIRAPGLPALTGALAGLVLVGAAAPLVTGVLPPRGAFVAVPGYWVDTAEWLAARDDGAALVVPSASFGTFYWGDPRDEPLQPLATTPWAVRDAVPLAPAGTIRLLDEIGRRISRGQGGQGLSTLLGRAGLRYVVVRNDLDYARADATRPVLVHEALARSPGIVQVAAFGSVVGGGSRPGLRVDSGLDLPYRAVEIFEVTAASPRVSAAPLSSTVVVAGAAESVGDLADAEVIPSGPVVLAGDVPADLTALLRTGTTIATDGYARREVDFGRVDDNASAVLAVGDPLRLHNPARDYLPYTDDLTTAAVPLDGAVSASSSLSDAGSAGGTEPDRQPYAAVDGDLTTSWSSSDARGGVGQWIELDAGRIVSSVTARLRLQPDVFGIVPTRVRVTSDNGSIDVPVPVPAADASIDTNIPVPGGRTRSLRVEALQMSDGGHGVSFVVAELSLPGVRPTRPLAVPGSLSTAGRVVLSTDRGRDACVLVGRRPLCAEGLGRAGEDALTLDRSLTGSSGSWGVTGQALPRPGPALDVLLTEGVPGVHAQTSSSAVQDPRGGPQTIVDGDFETGWVAASGDRAPFVNLTWGEQREITGVSVRLDAALAASAPTAIRAVSDTGQMRTAPIDEDNVALFTEPVLSSSLQVSFPAIRPEGTFNPFTGRTDLLPVGVSELVPLGVEDLVVTPDPEERLASPCGSGPEVVVDGRSFSTSVSGTRRSITDLEPQPVVLCASAEVTLVDAARVTMRAAPAWLPGDLVLDRGTGEATAALPVATSVVADGPDRRSVTVAARTEPVVLSVLENANPGWAATLDGVRLEPVILDGWHQGWVVPAGAAATVSLEFTPQPTYRLGLLVGLALVALLVLAAFVPARSPRRTPAIAAGPSGRFDLAVFGLALGWLAGVLGLVLAAASWWVSRLGSARRSWRPRLLELAPAVLVLAAGVDFVIRPWASVRGYAGDQAWPQVCVLLALGLALCPGSADEHAQALHGALQEDPAEPGDEQADGEGDPQDQPEVAGEGLDVERAEDEAEDQDVPQEQAVGDPAQPAHRGGAQRAVRHRP